MAGAVRTDFILSAEIMVIALKEVIDEPLAARAAILVIVALFITAIAYGVVALIVKMDDIGLRMVEGGGAMQGLGKGWARAGVGHAEGAHRAVDRRHGGDAVGGRPYPRRRSRRTGVARTRGSGPRSGPSTGGAWGGRRRGRMDGRHAGFVGSGPTGPFGPAGSEHPHGPIDPPSVMIRKPGRHRTRRTGIEPDRVGRVRPRGQPAPPEQR